MEGDGVPKAEPGGSGRSSGSGAASSEVEINPVTFKPLPFESSNIHRWFQILEAQFAAQRISNTRTKFNTILGSLSFNVANQLSDEVITSCDYATIKDALIFIHAQPKPELFDAFVNENKIMLTKPTLYLQEIRRIGQQLNLGDDFLRIKFLKALPVSQVSHGCIR